MSTGECLFPLESALFHQPATVDASIDLAKMAKKWSSSKTIMQNDTYRVLTLRLVVWTLTLPQVRKAPGRPPVGVPGAVYDEYLSTAPTRSFRLFPPHPHVRAWLSQKTKVFEPTHLQKHETPSATAIVM